MSDHEQLHEAREEDADRLENRNRKLEEQIEEARQARDEAAADDFVATELPETELEDEAPEADYPSKG